MSENRSTSPAAVAAIFALLGALIGAGITLYATHLTNESHRETMILGQKSDAYEKWLGIVNSPCGYHIRCLRNRNKATAEAMLHADNKLKLLLRNYEVYTVGLWGLANRKTWLVPPSARRKEYWDRCLELVPQIRYEMRAELGG